MLDDERHPVFDTWETLDTHQSAAPSTGNSEWSEPSESSSSLAEPLGPINWNTISADEAEAEWLDLNAWVNWLRGTYGLAPSLLPPMWHRHDELVWELSALHLHWLNCYGPDASPRRRWDGTATSLRLAIGCVTGSRPAARGWTAIARPGRPLGPVNPPLTAGPSPR
ncbi:hypothetical protein [Nocardioides alcanivorans]|uniref:hypothetical protein n=1 Tax=Nocardioides alcanivorans TaxID=2897352 RepID=UPI00289E3480|nr:hypothetical protein [Nocardioides alcanivorans]